MKVRVLFAVRIGRPDWAEELITEVPERIKAASEWARLAGFDRLRVAEIDLGQKPDFTKAINAH